MISIASFDRSLSADGTVNVTSQSASGFASFKLNLAMFMLKREIPKKMKQFNEFIVGVILITGMCNNLIIRILMGKLGLFSNSWYYTRHLL